MCTTRRTWACAGITLIELMVALSILVLLLVLGVPQLSSLVVREREVTALNEIIGLLTAARAEAVTARSGVSVCRRQEGTWSCDTSSNWSGGEVMAILDGDGDKTADGGERGVIRVFKPHASLRYLSAVPFLRFNHLGFASSSATIGICVDGRERAGRAVHVAKAGYLTKLEGWSECD